MTRRIALTLLFALTGFLSPGALAPTAYAEDWPQFRGPGGQGHSAEQDLPLEWSESRNVVWKTPVPGLGWSSPVVAGGRVWLTTATDDPRSQDKVSLRALAFDAKTGRELVNVEVFQMRGELLNPKNSHASPTPIVEGDRVYVHFGMNGTAALTTSGEIVWKTRLPYESQHGSGGSPALYGDLLIISCDGFDAAYVVALDKRTGKTRWRTFRRRPFSQAYTTPLAIRVGERDQIVSVGAFRTAAYDPESGKEIWRVSYPVGEEDGFSNVPQPVFGHGLIFITTGFQVPILIAVRVDGKGKLAEGDLTKDAIAWTLRRGVPYTPSPLLVGDELYVVSDLGVATCLDAETGEIRWQQRLGGNFSASPVYADGRIYFQNENGVTTVIAPGKEFRKLATNTLEGYTFASMAVSDGAIYLRSDSNLYRIGGR